MPVRPGISLFCATPESTGHQVHQGGVRHRGHNLGLKVIAEGVETPHQLDYLKALKCQYGQGYLFSTPRDSEQATQFIKERSGIGDGKKMVIANLRAFELFQGLDEEVLAEVAKICEEMTILAGYRQSVV